MLAAIAVVAAGAVFGSPLRAAADTDVSTWSALQAAVTGGGTVRLTADIASVPGERLALAASGSSTIDLNGHALSITTPSGQFAAIRVPVAAALTIADSSSGQTGVLSASGGDHSAGIGGEFTGGGSNGHAGDVTISGGAVTVSGGFRGAAIGGARYGSGGDVVITGGSLSATGGDWSAGVGAGSQSGSAGTITIAGTRLPGAEGTTGGSYVAADGSTGGPITLQSDPRLVRILTGNNVGNRRGTLSVVYAPAETVLPTIATTSLPDGEGAVAYASAVSYSGDPVPSIAITDGVLPLGLAFGPDGTIAGTPLETGEFDFTVTASSTVLDIPQTASQAYTLTIEPGDPWEMLQARFDYGASWALEDDLEAPAGEGLVVAAGKPVTLDLAGFDLVIGAPSTDSAAISVVEGAEFTAVDSVGGGLLDVTGGTRGAGIGGGRYEFSGAITLDGVEVDALGGQDAAAIGGGSEASPVGAVVINGAEVSATGGMFAAGIGGGGSGNGGTVTITDSDVTATGGAYAAGIGGGNGGSGGDVSFSGGSLTAHGGINGSGVGAGEGGEAGGTLSVGGVGIPGSGTSGGTSGSSPVTSAAVVTFTGTGPLVRVTSTDSGSSVPGKVEVAYAPEDEALPVITTDSVPTVYRGEAYDEQIEFSGVPDPVLSVTEGELPPGIELSEEGELTGTPTTLGDYTFTVTASSTVFDLPQTSSRQFTISVLWRALEELRAALAAGADYALSEDLLLPDGTTLAVGTGTSTLDLAGHDLVITSTASGVPAIGVPMGTGLVIVDSGDPDDADDVGTLTAIGGYQAAGIGRGFSWDSWGAGAGTITIQGGEVTATGGESGAGIGGGNYGSVTAVSVEGGVVTATGGDGAAGIGGGSYGTLGSVTISGGVVTATGGLNAAGIGFGAYASSGTAAVITVSGGDVTATGTGAGAGIGGGIYGPGGDVTVSGGTVVAIGAAGDYSGGPGVGQGMYGGDAGSLTVLAEELQGSTGESGGQNLYFTGGDSLAPAVDFAPNGSGAYALVTTVDADPTVAARSVTIEVFTADQVPGFLGGSDLEVDLDAPTSIQLTNAAATSIEVLSGTLPQGLEFSEDGELHGTPSELGTTAFTLRVSGEVAGLPQTHERTLTVKAVLRPWEDLQDAFMAGTSAVLGEDVAAPLGESLVVGAGSDVELDLAGHDLTIPTPALAIPGIAVPADGTLTIVDSVGGGTLTVAGGQDAAGIGSAAGELPGSVTIAGGIVTATGGGTDGESGGAGIGAGWGVVDLGTSVLSILAEPFGAPATSAGNGGDGTAAALAIVDEDGYPTSYTAVSTDGWVGSTTITIGHVAQFDVMGGTPAPAEQFVATGEYLAAPAVPRWYGHAFNGWYADPGFTQPFDFWTALTGPTTVYAGWASTIGTLSGSVTFPSWFDSSFGLGDIIATPLQGGDPIAIGVSNYDLGLQRGDFLFGLEPGEYLLRYSAAAGSDVASQYWPGATTAVGAGRLTVATDGTTTADLTVDGAAVTGVIALPDSVVVDPDDFVDLFASVVAGGVVLDQEPIPVGDPSVLPIAEPFTLTVPAETTDYQVVLTGTVHDGCDCSLVSTWRAVWSPPTPLGSDPAPVDIGTIELTASNAVLGTVSGPLDAFAAVVPVAYVLEGTTWRQLDAFDDPIQRWATDYAFLTGVEGETAPWSLGLLAPGEYRFGLLVSDVSSMYATWFVNDSGGSPEWSDAQTYTVGESSVVEVPEQELPALESVSELENVVAPTIAGVAQVGQALHANPGIWLPAPPMPVASPCGCAGSFTYQWFADGTEIPGAVGQTYWPQQGDIGRRLHVEVTAEAPGLAGGSAASTLTAVVVPGRFVSVPKPALSGVPEVGRLLTVSSTSTRWLPVAPTSVTFEWLRDGLPIGLPLDEVSYRLTDADAGHDITVRVTGSKPGFVSVSKLSIAKPVTGGVFESVPKPNLSGVAEVGRLLTVSLSASGWGAYLPTTVSYDWLRDGVSIGLPSDTVSYRSTFEDAGHTISVRVTGSRSGFVDASKVSSGKPIAGGQFTSVPKAGLSGVSAVGRLLSVGTSVAGWGPLPPTTLTYDWLCNGVSLGVDPATTQLRVTDGMRGCTISVLVTGSRPGFDPATKLSYAKSIPA